MFEMRARHRVSGAIVVYIGCIRIARVMYIQAAQHLTGIQGKHRIELTGSHPNVSEYGLLASPVIRDTSKFVTAHAPPRRRAE